MSTYMQTVVKLIEDYVFDAKSGKPMDVIDPLNGLASVVFTFPMGLVDGVYPETETYIDNYSIDIVKELPQITGVTLTHSDAAINANIDNAAKTIVLPNSITAAGTAGRGSHRKAAWRLSRLTARRSPAIRRFSPGISAFWRKMDAIYTTILLRLNKITI